MRQGCALWILRSKGQRSRSQCINYWKWFPAHNRFPFTPIIMKLHMQTRHEARMCPIDFRVKGSNVKVIVHWFQEMVWLFKISLTFTWIMPIVQNKVHLNLFLFLEILISWKIGGGGGVFVPFIGQPQSSFRLGFCLVSSLFSVARGVCGSQTRLVWVGFCHLFHWLSLAYRARWRCDSLPTNVRTKRGK